MKTTMPKLAVSMLLCACVAVLAGCGRDDPAARKGSRESGEVRVGAILPLTGLLAEMGTTEKQAIELAASHWENDADRPIRVIFEDGKGDAKSVVAAANKLISVDNVRMLITSTSGGSLAAQPVADSFGVPLIAFCMDTEIAAKSPTTIRYYLGLDSESSAISDYLLTLPSNMRVAILHGSISAWVTAVQTIYQPRLSKHFTTPLLIEEYDLKIRDFRPQLAKIRSAHADVLVILGYGFEYGPLFAQIEEIGIRESAQIVGGWGFLYTSLTPTQLENIKVAGPKYVFERGQLGAAFDDDYERRYGRPPNFDAAFAYELARQLPTLMQIVERDGPKMLKQTLSGKGQIDGVMGPYTISADGNMNAHTAVGVFRSGRLTSF